MKISRRELLKTASIAGAGATAAVINAPLVNSGRAQQNSQSTPGELPPAFNKLQPLGDRVKPIRVDELQGRIAHAQELMTNAKPRFDALYVTPGTTLAYYVGTPWGLSERIVALMIPREGQPLMICPAFEEGRLREQLRWPIELRVWQEDESPYALIAKWLAERGIRTGRVGVEETTKYVFYDGLRQAASSLDYGSGNPVTVGMSCTEKRARAGADAAGMLGHIRRLQSYVCFTARRHDATRSVGHDIARLQEDGARRIRDCAVRTRGRFAARDA